MRVLDDQGNGYTSDVIDAVNYAVANKNALGIGVINLSLGHPIYEPAGTDPLCRLSRMPSRTASSWSWPQETLAATLRHMRRVTPALRRPAMRRVPSRLAPRETRRPQLVVTIRWRGSVREDRAGTTDTRSRTSSRPVRIRCRTSRRAATHPVPGRHRGSAGQFGLVLQDERHQHGGTRCLRSGCLDVGRPAHLNGRPLTPNAVKAILDYTAIPMAGADVPARAPAWSTASVQSPLCRSHRPKAAPGCVVAEDQCDAPTTIAGTSLGVGVSAWSGVTAWCGGDQIFHERSGLALALCGVTGSCGATASPSGETARSG